MLLWKTEHSKVYKYSTIITKCIHIEIIIENGKVLQVINTCIVTQGKRNVLTYGEIYFKFISLKQVSSW